MLRNFKSQRKNFIYVIITVRFKLCLCLYNAVIIDKGITDYTVPFIVGRHTSTPNFWANIDLVL